MKILLIIVIFLLIGGFLIMSNENLRLNSWENAIYFAGLYYNWLAGFYEQGKYLTGDVIKFFNG